MLPTSTTGSAMREPSALSVHTIVPTRTSVTRTGPFGVAIIVDAARQMGQFGGPDGDHGTTVTPPPLRTVPVIRSLAPLPPVAWSRCWDRYPAPSSGLGTGRGSC